MPPNNMQPFQQYPQNYGQYPPNFQNNFNQPNYGGFGRGVTIKLSGLPYSVSKYEINEFLTGTRFIPNTINIERGRDGRPTGVATVMYPTTQDGQMAIKTKHKKYIGQRYVVVSFDD